MSKRLLWGLILLVLWVMPVQAQYYFSDPNVAYQEALRRIEDARVSGATELNLAGFGLQDVPPEISQLINVKNLYLNSNHLTRLLPEIGQLTNLGALYVGSNHLTRLPPEIGQLTKLIMLDLTDNDLTMLPPEIGQLTQLLVLGIADNQLTTLPPEIRHLTSLTRLHAQDNQLTMLPPEIGQIPSLQELYLNDNPLKALPLEIAYSQLKILSTGPLPFIPLEIQQQSTEGMLAYLRDYEAMQARQTIAGIAAGVGAMAGLMLAFRWRQRRGLSEKKKRL